MVTNLVGVYWCINGIEHLILLWFMYCGAATQSVGGMWGLHDVNPFRMCLDNVFRLRPQDSLPIVSERHRSTYAIVHGIRIRLILSLITDTIEYAQDI